MTLSGDHFAPGGKLKGGGTSSTPSVSVFYARVVKIVPVGFGGDTDITPGIPNVAAVSLLVENVESLLVGNAESLKTNGLLSAWLPSNLASSAGGTITVPRIGDVVVCLSGTSGNTFVIGSVHGYNTKPVIHKDPKDNETSIDYHLPWPIATTEALQSLPADGDVLTQGTGFRIPDQAAKWQPSWGHTTSPGGKPTGGSISKNNLLDKNLFFNVGYTAWKTPTKKVKDTTFEKHSYGFQQVQSLLANAQDAAYKTADIGLGFNEIMIRSRSATSSSSGKAGSWSKTSDGGVSVYGQDYVDLWSTGSVTTIAKDNLTFAAGEKLVIEAGTEISLRVGRSGITLTEDGVVISQTNCEAITSYWKMTPFSIESFALNEVHSAWFFSVVGAWSSLNMGPGTFAATGMMNATISSGAYSYFGLGTLSTAATAAAFVFDARSGATGAVGEGVQTALLSQLGLPINLKYDKNIQNNTLPTCNLGLSAATLVTSIVSSVVGTFIPSVIAAATTRNSMGSSGVACIGSNIAVNAGFRTGAGGSMAPVSKGSVRIQATQSVGMFGYMGSGVAIEGAALAYLRALQVATLGSIGAAIAGGIALANRKSGATTDFLSAVTLSRPSSCLFHSDSASIMAPKTMALATAKAEVKAVLPGIRESLINLGGSWLPEQPVPVVEE